MISNEILLFKSDKQNLCDTTLKPLNKCIKNLKYTEIPYEVYTLIELKKWTSRIGIIHTTSEN